jgi:hypothetical protein
MNKVEDRSLTEENVAEINCSPGGLEVQGKTFKGDITRTLIWRQEMLKQGMKGLVSYHKGVGRGFAEYMTAERAPFPIEAPGAAVLMCYHWEPLAKGDQDEHLAQEKRLIDLVAAEARESFTGLATMGWGNPVHFPIVMLEELGFEQLGRCGDMALMWMPFKKGAGQPWLAPATLVPQDLSSQGIVAIESASSSRCPYSIHNAAKLEQVITGLPEENRMRLRHFSHVIDTHEDAVRWAIAPWNWEWAFVNGEEVPVFQMGSDDLRQLIMGKVAALQIS